MRTTNLIHERTIVKLPTIQAHIPIPICNRSFDLQFSSAILGLQPPSYAIPQADRQKDQSYHGYSNKASAPAARLMGDPFPLTF
jgi:hypothetical protein